MLVKKWIYLSVVLLMLFSFSGSAQQWSGLHILSGSSYVEGNKVIAHSSGTKYVVGTYLDVSEQQKPRPNFNCQSLPDPCPEIRNWGMYGFVLKYNKNNEIDFIRPVPSRVSDIAVDADQNYYVIGMLDNQVQLNETIHGASGNEGLLMKYDPDGNLKWWKIITCGGSFATGSSTALFNSIDLTTQGEVIVCGRSNVSGTLLPDFMIESGTFLLKFDSLGNLLKYRPVPGWKSEVKKVMVSSNDEIYLGGTYRRMLFTNETHNAVDNYDGFIAKMDKDFNELWFKSYGSESFQYYEFISSITEYNRNIYFSANYLSRLNVEGTELDIDGEFDIYVASIDTSGSLNWVTRVGGSGDERLRDISVNSSGIYITGNYTGIPDMGGFEPKGGRDMFYAKVSHYGEVQKFVSFGTESPTEYHFFSSEVSNSICADDFGAIWLTGQVRKNGSFGDFSYLVEGPTDCFIAQYAENENVKPIEIIDCPPVFPELSLFPNPVIDYFRIRTSERILSVQIFDATGKELLTLARDDIEKPYDIRFLSSGVYILEVITAQGTKTLRIVKI